MPLKLSGKLQKVQSQEKPYIPHWLGESKVLYLYRKTNTSIMSKLKGFWQEDASDPSGPHACLHDSRSEKEGGLLATRWTPHVHGSRGRQILQRNGELTGEQVRSRSTMHIVSRSEGARLLPIVKWQNVKDRACSSKIYNWCCFVKWRCTPVTLCEMVKCDVAGPSGNPVGGSQWGGNDVADRWRSTRKWRGRHMVDRWGVISGGKKWTPWENHKLPRGGASGPKMGWKIKVKRIVSTMWKIQKI